LFPALGSPPVLAGLTGVGFWSLSFGARGGFVLSLASGASGRSGFLSSWYGCYAFFSFGVELTIFAQSIFSSNTVWGIPSNFGAG